jgi:PTH1 family peptidyl-tRNA hydrolase
LQVLVVCDDLDSEFGVVKLKEKGGHGGHNGVRSIVERCGGDSNFARVKIGIGRPPGRVEAGDYVLEKFGIEEMEMKEVALQKAVNAIESICSLGLDMALSGKRV